MKELFKYREGQKIIEFAGGSKPSFHPHVDDKIYLDVNDRPCVDFVVDFGNPLPIKDNEWDVVFSKFLFNRMHYTKVVGLAKEILRILKPGGKSVLIVRSSDAAFEYIRKNQYGWDGDTPLNSFSKLIYEEGEHKSYWNPSLMANVLRLAGFSRVDVRADDLDFVVEAFKAEEIKTMKEEEGIVVEPNMLTDPIGAISKAAVAKFDKEMKGEADVPTIIDESKERGLLFDKHYFNGGGKVGGYAREGYWDYPVHWITFDHIMKRNPKSVLELGCARGYIIKRLEDAGIPSVGFEISQHCYMTRVMDQVYRADICHPSWPYVKEKYVKEKMDLCFSIAVMEHIPEDCLPYVLNNIRTYSERGLHGIDFGHKDDGFDKTHCTLKDRSWWRAKFDEFGLQSHEIVDKEELEQGAIRDEVYKDNGLVKLNIGSFTTMYHHGWVNIDIHPLHQFATAYKYNFLQWDCRNGLPFDTGSVDRIACCHMLEHLTYKEGLAFLRDCRRVLKPESGVMRIQVPDAGLLMRMYFRNAGELDDFDEINDGCGNSPTAASKVWSLLHEGHLSCYDWNTLANIMTDAGFCPILSEFRKGDKIILSEGLDVLPCLTLYVEGCPSTSK